MVGEVEGSTVTAVYLRGTNLISDGTSYYLYNAHGDVVQLTDSTGAVTKSYDYDAFGNEKDPDEADSNPFRYCGEYFDAETGLYYLRARYYDPALGRFTQEDTYWNAANMIYGDNPQKINERQDALGLKTYSYAPQISAIVQSGNLYVYCGNDPLNRIDPTGNEWYHWLLGGLIVAGAAAAVILTAGGALPALYAVGAVASGIAFGGAATTITAGIFIGSSLTFGMAALTASMDAESLADFSAQGNWWTVVSTIAGATGGGLCGYALSPNQSVIIAGKGSTGRTDALNLNEQLAMKQVLSNPLQGAVNLSALPKNPVVMSDPRWLAEDGWVKMQNTVVLSNNVKIVIHFVYNIYTHMFDDFKFA